MLSLNLRKEYFNNKCCDIQNIGLTPEHLFIEHIPGVIYFEK